MILKYLTYLLLAVFLWMIRDVLVALLLAAVFVTVLYPFFLRIKIGIETHFHLKKPSTLRPAFIVTFLFVLTVFTPVSFMVLWAVKTVFSLVKGIQIENLDVEHFNLWSAEIWSNLPESLRSVFDRLMSFVDMETLKPYASDVSKSLLMTLSNLLSTFMSSIPSLLLSTFFFLLGMFYFLADSEKIMRIFNRIRTKSGVSEDVVHRLLLKWRGLSRGVLVAGLASGLFQAFVFSLMMLLVGPREYALLTFALVFIFSFVPLIGSMPVTWTIIAYQLIHQNGLASVVLIVTALILSVADNIIRAKVLSDGSSQLHPMMGFLGAIMGIQLFGPVGIFLGPVFVGMLSALMDESLLT